MKISYYTNAMILIEGKNTKLLSDPWITFDNHSETNYYNFPENIWSEDDIRNIKPDFIYLTHSHPDHFDPITLGLFDKQTPILIANFKNRYFEKSLKSLGFKNVIISDNKKGIKLNGNDISFIYPAETTDELDSIGYFQIDNYKILNVNDNIENFRQCLKIKNNFKKIDVALLPYCGFGNYPLCYDNLKENEKLKAAEEKKMETRKKFLKYVKSINPEYVIPFAGEVVLGGEKAKIYEKFSGIGTKKDAVDFALSEYKKFEPLMMSGGCSFDFKNKVMEGKFIDTNFGLFPEYLSLLSKKNGKYEKNGKFFISKELEINPSMFLTKAIKNLNVSRKKRKMLIPETIPYIDIKEEYIFRLDFNNEKIDQIKINQITDKQYEIFKLPYSLLIALLTRHCVFSNVIEDLNYYRVPNQYDKDLHFLMNFLAL